MYGVGARFNRESPMAYKTTLFVLLVYSVRSGLVSAGDIRFMQHLRMLVCSWLQQLQSHDYTHLLFERVSLTSHFLTSLSIDSRNNNVLLIESRTKVEGIRQMKPQRIFTLEQTFDISLWPGFYSNLQEIRVRVRNRGGGRGGGEGWRRNEERELWKLPQWHLIKFSIMVEYRTVWHLYSSSPVQPKMPDKAIWS